MSEIFQVTHRGMIRKPRNAGGGYLKAGTRMTRDQIREWGMEQSLSSLLQSGFLVRLHEIEADAHSLGPGVQPPKPLPANADRGVQTHERGDKVVIQQKTSLWDADPATLQDKDLEALNVMIQELDSKVEPFSEKAAAIAWLSQDFEGEQVATG